MSILTKEQRFKVHTELNITRLENLSKLVSEGARTANSIVDELNNVARELRQINNL
tara:strand:+ start:177 stop:344 length:168 start_codon:yes stop_codon:yes gene_type:complete